MFLLSKPNKLFIADFLASSRQDNFSYIEIGATKTEIPKNYTIDHNRIKIGKGADDFEKAVEAVKNWKMFEISWVHLYPKNTPIEVGQTVSLLINHFGFWSLNASRIVYVINEKSEIEKFGFAYGTLDKHGLNGEERFTIEWNHQTDEVWYDLFAFSTPKYLIAKIGYPLNRFLQKQFAKESKMAMLKAII